MPVNPNDYLRASNGVGEAVRANVVVDREIGSFEINVDTVLNWPDKFIATSGTLDSATGTFDPTTVTVFYGHINGTYIEIDEFAPGYADNGNTANQLVVLKPTTPWADAVAERSGLPAGGTTGQALVKASDADQDVEWGGTQGNSSINFNQPLAGTIDGTNAVFTTLVPFTDIIVYKNGVRMQPGAANDYTVTGNNEITFNSGQIPTSGIVTADYITSSEVMISGSNSMQPGEVPTGTIDGTNTVFTTSTSYIGTSLAVFVNGVRQSMAEGHYTETTPSSGIFTFADAPLVGDNIVVTYMSATSVTGNADTVDGFHANATPVANTILPLDSNGYLPDAAISSSTTTSFTFNTGWSSQAGHTVRATKVGRTVYLSGLLNKNASWVVGESPVTIPSGFRPSSRMSDTYIIYQTATASTTTSYAGGTISIYVTGSGQDGQIVTRITGASGNWISLNGISYEVA